MPKHELDFNNIILEDCGYTISITQNSKDGAIDCEEMAVLGPGAMMKDVFFFHYNDHLSFLNAYSEALACVKRLRLANEEMVTE